MVQWVSAASRIAFAREDTFGALAEAFGGTGGEGSSSPRLLGITNSGAPMMDKQTDIHGYRSFGSGRNFFLKKTGRNQYKGNQPMLPVSGEMFYYALGEEDFQADTPTTGTNRHVLTPKVGAVLPSLNLAGALLGSPDFLRVFLGGTVNGLNVNLNENAELAVDLDLMGRNVDRHDEAAPTIFTQPVGSGADPTVDDDPQPYMFYDRTANVTMLGSYTAATHSITGGTTLANVNSFSWGIQNNLDPRWYSHANDAQLVDAFLLKFPDFTVELEIEPEDKLTGNDESVYHLLEDETRGDILIPFERPDGSKLDFVFEDALLQSSPHPFAEDGGVTKVSVKPDPEDIRVVVEDTLPAYASM